MLVRSRTRTTAPRSQPSLALSATASPATPQSKAARRRGGVKDSEPSCSCRSRPRDGAQRSAFAGRCPTAGCVHVWRGGDSPGSDQQAVEGQEGFKREEGQQEIRKVTIHGQTARWPRKSCVDCSSQLLLLPLFLFRTRSVALEFAAEVVFFLLPFSNWFAAGSSLPSASSFFTS